jgi:hypothetical protein
MPLIMTTMPCAICGKLTAVGPTELQMMQDSLTAAPVCQSCEAEIKEARACRNVTRLAAIQNRAIARAVGPRPN